MILNFILGRAGSGKTYYTYKKIREKVENGSSKLILIVPEQFTLQAEADLITKMELPGIINVQVLSFRRLAYRILSEVGGIKKNVITDLGKLMFLRKIFEENREELKIFQKAYVQEGFLKEFSVFLSELKKNGIAEEELYNKIGELEQEGILKNKLSDISLIYKKYDQEMEGSYIDEDERLDLLAEKIEVSDFLEGAEIWIDGFNSFSIQEYRILEKLLLKCKEATVSLTYDPDQKAKDYDLFEPTDFTYRTLRKICDKNMIPVGLLDFEKRINPNEELAHLERNLYSFPPDQYVEESNAIKIFSALNQYGEVENTAEEIIELVRDKGYRWKDIAVVSNSLETYSPVIKRIFNEYDIPVFIDEKKNITSNPLINYIKSALRIIINNYQYEDVFRYLKTGLTELKKEEYEKLENYVLEYGIRGKSWKEDFGYIRNHERPAEQELLKSFNRSRKIFSAPLERLFQNIGRRNTTRNIAMHLYNFLIDSGVDKKLEDLLEEKRKAGEFEFVNENSQIWNIIIEVLDQIVEISGEEEVELTDFLKLLETGFNNYELGLIPPTMDQVLAGNLERSKSHDIKALFLLGVNDGIIPRTFNDSGIILDDEKKMMQDIGLELYSDNTYKLKEEKFSVYTALTKPAERLYISYSVGDLEGRALRPSILIDRFKRMYGIQEESELDIPGDNFLRKISGPVPTFKFLLENLRRYLDYGNLDPKWWNVYKWYFKQVEWLTRRDLMISGLFHENQVKNLDVSLAEKAYFSLESYSISRLETYANCPFKHFVKYGLNPRERKEYEVALPDIGTLFHNALEIFPGVLAEKQLLWKETEKNKAERIMEEIVDRMSAEFQNGILESSSRNRYLKEKLNRVSRRAIATLTEQLQKGEFEPWKYETSFREILLEEKIFLEGRIDRLDLCRTEEGNYIRVIDYKSGSKKFSLQELYHLIQLQLIIYLMGAISKSEEILGETVRPAGAFYFIIDDPMIENDGNDQAVVEEKIRQELKMDGFLLKDPSVIRAMDNSLENGGNSDIIPVKVKNDGEFSAGSSVFSEEELRDIIGYTKKKILIMIKEIIDGKIRIEPCKSSNFQACTYCDYRTICQFDRAFPDNDYRNLQKIKKDEILKIIREEGNQDGKMDS